MSWERRPEDETPTVETRTFTDDDGRRWAGSVMSGRFAGGEERAEVIFVCEDQPSEAKRFARLDTPGGSGGRVARMDEERILSLFRDSERA
jgi:hypothetical protein